MGDIYGIVQKENNRIVYVGQTIQTYKIRWQQHKQQAKNGRPYALYNALRKYGVDAFYPILIEQCDNSLLNQREKYWIKYYHTMWNEEGYNLTEGGDSNSQAQCKEIYQFGLDGELIKKFNSIRAAAKEVSGDITKETLIAKCIERGTHRYKDFYWSFEDSINISLFKKPKSKKILQYDLHHNFVAEYDSARQAGLALGKENGVANISAVARGERKTAYGYYWEYSGY